MLCRWGLTDEEPTSQLGETIDLGVGESVYSESFVNVEVWDA
jgi:hypothetical protein